MPETMQIIKQVAYNFLYYLYIKSKYAYAGITINIYLDRS